MKYVRATHHKESLTVEYVADDNSRYLRSGGTICWRFFNPGNIRPSKTSVCDRFKIGIGDTKSGEFMIFPSYEVGWKALKLLLSITYKDFIIERIANKFAPKKDKNDPEKYTRFLVKESGINSDVYVRDLDDSELERLMEAIKKMEGFYNKIETRREKPLPVTNIIASDGTKPIANEIFKVVIGQCTYEWSTNKYGQLPTIAHLVDGDKIEVLSKDIKGVDEKIYSSVAEGITKSILFLKKSSSFMARTGAHKEGDKSTSVYHVKKGDTLSKIAREFRTSVKRIANLNNIKDVNVLSIGQELKIPGKNALPSEVLTPQHQQASNIPASNTPASNTPASNTPASNIPASNTPASNTPASNTPVSNTPVSNTPTSNTPTSNTQTSNTQTSNTSSDNNQRQSTGRSDAGYPQSNIDTSTIQAPWMKVALEEAKRWAGKTEVIITESVNYHQIVGVHFDSLIGDDKPWCASFINYCLITSVPRYPKCISPADSLAFSTDRNNFKRISAPVFGAIAVYTRPGGGHCSLVYGLSSARNGNIIVLGGNQSDQINFVDRSTRRLVGYFVPIQYEQQALREIASLPLGKYSANELNASLRINTPVSGREL
ncbi:hypothetical protein C9426_33715 [Serratia sp. S1B]|nr:hypothetical protein C9426_33715 [Serratia sp. S1B]